MYAIVSSSPVEFYALGSVLTYSSISMVHLTTSSVLVARSLVHSTISMLHLEYMNHMLVILNSHHINMSIRILLGQERQAAYVLRLIGSGVTSSIL